MTTTNPLPMDDPAIHERRKADHIRINLEEDVFFKQLTNGLEKYFFMHRALPEINLHDIDTSIEIMGKRLQRPLLISSMTGGTAEAREINRTLARAAQELGMAMGLGSMRAVIEDESLVDTYTVRDVAPDILLFSNLGAVQFNYGYGVDECRRAVELYDADALILHFNTIQEATQPEGDGDFSNLLPKIEEVCKKLEVPVIAKEVGWGFAEEDARMLANAGVSAIDVAGAGGTSWSQVEMYRAPTKRHAQVAAAFVDWGIPTAVTLQYCHRAAPDMTLFASGGIRNGIEVAKCIALGASAVGLAGEFLRAAHDNGLEGAIEFAETLTDQLRITMFGCGAKNLAELSQTKLHTQF